MSRKNAPEVGKIESYGPFDVLEPKKAIDLAWRDLRPVIRVVNHYEFSDFRLPRRIIFDHMLQLMTAGQGTLRLEDEEIPVTKYDVILVPPFTPHIFAIKEATSHYSIHFDWTTRLPGSFLNETGRRPYQIALPARMHTFTTVSLPQGDPVLQQIPQIVGEWTPGEPLRQLAAEAMLFHVLVQLIKRSEAATVPPKQHDHIDRARVDSALRLMEARLHEKLTPKEIAAVTGLSPSYFAHLFRRCVGHSIMEHLAWLRIERAKQMLSTVGLTVKEIAFRCGFEDHHYFSRAFTRTDGLSPSQYRETMLSQLRTPAAAPERKK